MHKLEKFRSWARNGLQKFCDYTSIHGFYELYHAKNYFWFLFWISICAAAFMVTVHQVYVSAAQYMESSTITIMVPAKEDDIQYPVFSLCFFHWYLWVDWNKAMSLNVSKEALLYGFSYYNYIFYQTKVDINESRAEFVSMMKANNFNTLSEFYFYVSKDIPIVNDNGAKDYFNKKQILFNVNYNMLCYQISAGSMKRMFKRAHTAGSALQPKILQFDLPDKTYKNFDKLVTVDEHQQYVRRWMEKFTLYQLDTNNPDAVNENFTSFIPPKIVVLSGSVLKGTRIQMENEVYFFHVRASAYTWQNVAGKPCNDSTKALSTDLTCQDLCELDYHMVSRSCLALDVASRRKQDTMDSVCARGFRYPQLTDNGTVEYLSLSGDVANISTDDELLKDYYTCTNNCLPACQIWTYDETLSITTASSAVRKVGRKNVTTVRVEFPMGKDCIIMSDADAQSWEGFVGNVGGLLGIWTGASIVSFIQFFYLCCCSDNCECWGRRSKKKTNVHSMPQTITVSPAEQIDKL